MFAGTELNWLKMLFILACFLLLSCFIFGIGK